MNKPELQDITSSLKEKAEISFQTLAVVFLGWLATSVSSLDSEIKDLNGKMSVVVTQVKTHGGDINQLQQQMHDERMNQQNLRVRIWDEINKLRYKISEKDSKNK